MMTYQEIFNEISNSAYNRFSKGLNYEGLQSTLVECATKIYIEQMKLDREELLERNRELLEENKELHKKYNELLEESNRKSNEPVERRQTLADWLKEKEEEKNVKE